MIEETCKTTEGFVQQVTIPNYVYILEYISIADTVLADIRIADISFIASPSSFLFQIGFILFTRAAAFNPSKGSQ